MRALGALLVLAITITGCSSGGTADRRSTGNAVTTSVGATSDEGAVVSSTAAPDPIEAAIAYIASTDQLMAHSPIGRREILRRLVTPTAVEAQIEAFESAATSMADTLGVTVDRLTWVEAPLTARLVAADADRASVDVWSVSVLGAPDLGPPQQAWRTVHVDLDLLNGAWFVTGATAVAGPTPQLNELALPSTWEEFVVAARWPAAVEGVGL